MCRLKILVLFFLSLISTLVAAQVKIRLFAKYSPESVVLSVTNGSYIVKIFNNEKLFISKKETVLITRYNGKLAVKIRNSVGFICDSVSFAGQTGNDSFSMRINGQSPVRQFYSGDLKCFADMATLVMINICNVEKYIAGVVRSEGGSGKNIEYFKTQAVIARTYMYKNMEKHISDGYNLCDNTHCQAFNGLSSDRIINQAAMETKDLVILDRDSTLIIAAFH